MKGKTMKTWKKMAVCMTALLSAFTMTSCLGDSDSNSGPDYYNVPVTVSTSSIYGTALYADMGCTFIPTQASLANVDFSKVKRAIVAFSFVDEGVTATSIQLGKSYNVALESSYCYGIPTYYIADDFNNEAADSLSTRQTGISSISTTNTYVANGYLTTTLTVPYSGSTAYSMAMVYNSEEDLDGDNNTLTLNLQYAHNATSANYSGSSLFSFKMPEGIASKFSGDSVNITVRALAATASTESYMTVKTKAARTDLTSKY
jgi:hypothetical protein